mgnify:CR=1 FL=1
MQEERRFFEKSTDQRVIEEIILSVKNYRENNSFGKKDRKISLSVEKEGNKFFFEIKGGKLDFCSEERHRWRQCS